MCAAVSEVFDIFNEEKIMEHIREVCEYLWNKLEELKAKYDCIVDHRGRGLIQVLELNFAPKEFVSKSQERGLILIAAENNTIRFVSPLVVSKLAIGGMCIII